MATLLRKLTLSIALLAFSVNLFAQSCPYVTTPPHGWSTPPQRALLSKDEFAGLLNTRLTSRSCYSGRPSIIAPVAPLGTPSVRTAPPVVSPLGPCDTIMTTFVADNGNDGVMFNLTAINPITISQFYTSIDAAADPDYIKIYYMPGALDTATNAQNPSAWTLIDSAITTSAGFNVPTLIPIMVNVSSPAEKEQRITGNG